MSSTRNTSTVIEQLPDGARSHSDFLDEFIDITGLHPTFDVDYRKALDRLIRHIAFQELRPLDLRRREFVAYINLKFRLNAEPLARLYAKAAAYGVTFHYHQKCSIQRAFDLRQQEILETVFNECCIPLDTQTHLIHLFKPIDESDTIAYLKEEYRKPTKLRKEKGDRDIEGEIVKSLFSAFVWVSLPEKEMHRFFDPQFSDEHYCESFWDQLHVRSPQLFNRNNALHIVRISQDVVNNVASVSQLRDSLTRVIADLYDQINNYGFLAFIIEPVERDGRSLEWEIAADITLCTEKHQEFPLDKAYFRWESIRDTTASYIPGLDQEAASFELVNEGFTYRDCFVIATPSERIERLLLLFQKNKRDETPIPCPTCRSSIVQGNSYPSLGVRSWECSNLLCPDRSKYNRGKRYSFRGLMMQHAIDDDRNEITQESVRCWIRDVVIGMSDNELADMLIRHYSMYGDTIHIHNWLVSIQDTLGRNIIHHQFEFAVTTIKFWDGPFFRRYITSVEKASARVMNMGDEDFQVLLGDSSTVLRSLPSSFIDGAVTSPPYYNAREYAQWPNIYCYLHDMYDINKEVFRTLKPGAIYLFNIFDYFDNENSVVFSAMGQRRMLLSAYTVDLFRRIGYELIGNVVWDKGDIEGKRGFNAGNYAPFYQAPFNCWEHILVFNKPTAETRDLHGNTIMNYDDIVGRVLRQQPVIKMVRGENIHGHTAPFPDAIPELLVSRLPKGSVVLDPFGGSLTTGRVAERNGLRSICIERSEEYCRLGLRMRDDEREAYRAAERQLRLQSLESLPISYSPSR